MREEFDFRALVLSSDLRVRLPPLLYKCGGKRGCICVLGGNLVKYSIIKMG